MKLNLAPNITDADGFYEELVQAQRDLSPEQGQLMLAKLVLILANQLGDRAALSQAIALAKPRSMPSARRTGLVTNKSSPTNWTRSPSS